MTLRARIDEDMKAAMRAREELRLRAIRLLRAAIQRREVDERVTLDDTQILGIIDKLMKQGRDAAAQFRQAGRDDLAVAEDRDMAFWAEYLPQPLGPEETERLIAEALEATSASSVKDLGKVVGWLKPKVQGRADLGQISARIKERLAPKGP